MDKSSKCIFDEEIVYLVSIWVSPWISIMVIMICYSIRGSPNGSMTHVMAEHCVGKYHVMFFDIFEKAPTICVESTLSIFTYVFSIFILTCSCFRVKIANGNHHMSTFVCSVDEVTRIFIENFPDGWVLFRYYQDRSVSNN